MSFPTKRLSLREEFPYKTTFPVFLNLQNWIPYFANPFFIENFTHPFVGNFQTTHSPLNKGELFPAMKGVLRVLILY